MKSKRTKVDFSKHELHIIQNEEVLIHDLKLPNSVMNRVKFINCHGICAVTGDFGNWIFCREFHPSKDGYVSEGYWIEKLQIASEQELDKLDLEAIEKEIEELLDHGLEDYGYEGEKLEQAKEWYSELLENTDDELSYLYKAYRDYNKPSFIEYEEIPYTK